MNLTKLSDAVGELAQALEDLSASEKRWVLKVALEAVSDGEADSDEEPPSVLPAPLQSAPDQGGLKPEAPSVDVADAVATKLVAQGWGYETALVAAQAAIRERGKTAGVDVLTRIASAIGPKKKRGRRTDERGRPLGTNQRRPRRVLASIQDAADFVRDRKKATTREYAAVRGLTMAGARQRLSKARDLDLVEGVGAPRSHDFYWVPKGG